MPSPHPHPHPHPHPDPSPSPSPSPSPNPNQVHEALTEAGVPTAMLKGTANQRSTIIESFQSKEEV